MGDVGSAAGVRHSCFSPVWMHVPVGPPAVVSAQVTPMVFRLPVVEPGLRHRRHGPGLVGLAHPTQQKR